MNEVPRRLERRAGVSPTQTVVAIEARVGDPLPCVTIDERTGIIGGSIRSVGAGGANGEGSSAEAAASGVRRQHVSRDM